MYIYTYTIPQKYDRTCVGASMREHMLEHRCSIIIFASSPLSPNVEPCKYHVFKTDGMPYHYTSYRRLMGCLIIIPHFPHRSLIMSGSFAENDLQIKASFSADKDLQLKASNLHHPLVAFSLTPRTLTSTRTAAWKSRIRENGAQYAVTILRMLMHA